MNCPVALTQFLDHQACRRPHHATVILTAKQYEFGVQTCTGSSHPRLIIPGPIDHGPLTTQHRSLRVSLRGCRLLVLTHTDHQRPAGQRIAPSFIIELAREPLTHQAIFPPQRRTDGEQTVETVGAALLYVEGEQPSQGVAQQALSLNVGGEAVLYPRSQLPGQKAQEVTCLTAAGRVIAQPIIARGRRAASAAARPGATQRRREVAPIAARDRNGRPRDNRRRR